MPPQPPIVCAFGSVRLVRAGVEVELSRRRERNVLAVLVAAHGRPVSADRLVVEVWGEEAPSQALASLQVAVSRLRSMLEPERAPRTPATVLLSTAAGYALALPDDAVDVWGFDALVERAAAAATPLERRNAAHAARVRWSAEPFGGCEAESVVREIERLRERYVSAGEIHARALLDLGDPAAAVEALGPLLPDNPYRERLWATHALALYRTARQSDALESLRVLRERLADDLGIDPSAEVAALELAVLNQDTSLLDTAWVQHAGDPSRPTPKAPELSPATQHVAGREAELASLADLVDRVTRTRRAGFAVVSGEPGIGKSHLVAQVPTLTAGRVVVGRSHPDFAPPLWPWLSVLRELWDEAPDGADAELLAPVLADSPREVATGHGDVLRLFDAVCRLLVRAAGSGPLVVVLEDLHWTDVTSLRLLGHLAASDLRAPLLFVTTLRTADVATSDALVATMADLARAGAERVRVAGLPHAAIADLLRAVLGPHDLQLDDVVAEVTAGNPFFVLEYARLVQGLPRSDALDPARLPVPEGVRDVLRQRLARLPEGARAVLATAAVAGRIEPELLSTLTSTPVDEVLDLLDLALASGILADTGTGYHFAHALTRDALAADLGAARRLRLHEQVARTLEARYGETPDVLAEVAHHADLAAVLGPDATARAAAALARAARAAQARRAYDESLALWRRADARASGPDTVALRVQALSGAAHSLIRLGRAPEARAAVVEATGIARDAGRWDLVADTAAILNRGGVWNWREPDSTDLAFVDTLHVALDHVDDVRRARLLALLQVEHYYAWDREAGDELGERSVEVARQTGDQAVLLEVLLVYVVAHCGPGTAHDRLARVEELRSNALDGELAVFAEFTHARILYECARAAEADAAAARCAAAVEQLHHTGVEVPLAWWFLARAREAEDPALVAAALARLASSQRRGTVTAAGIDVLYRLRTADDHAPVPDDVIEAARRTGAGQRAVIAYEVLERGDVATALGLLGEPTPPGASDYSVLAERCLRVAVLVGAGVTNGLEDAVAAIERYSGDVVTFGAVEHLGAVDYYVALGAAALGDRERARQHCTDALELLDRLGNRRWRRRADALATDLGLQPDPVR